MWETARAADESAAVAGQLAEEAADTELTEDTVRMYLREISRVALLTADDEVVLARAVEIAQWLEKIEAELTIDDLAPPDSFVLSEALTRLSTYAPTLDALARYLGLPAPVTLRMAVNDPAIRAALDGRRDDEIVNFVADALSLEPNDAHANLTALSVLSRLVAP